MPKIFISYRRSDSITISGRLYDHLAQAFKPQNVFKDVDNIPPGKDFRKVLENEVGACDVLLVIIGQNWVNVTDENGQRRLEDPDDFVRLEVASGLKRDDILVIPVLVNDATMPDISELPPELQELPFLNAVTVRNDPDFRRDVQRLIEYIRRSIRSSRNSLIPLIAIVAVLVLMSAGYFIWAAREPDVPTNLELAQTITQTSTLNAQQRLDLTATEEARLAQDATLIAEIGSLALTRTATLWTATPTLTHTPTLTYTPTHTTTPTLTSTPSADDWIQQAESLEQQGNLRGAVSALLRATVLEPDNADAHERIGHIAYTLGDFNLAVTGFSEAYQHNPDSYWAARGLADSYTILEDYDNALEAWDTVIEQYPYDYILYLGRGHVLTQLNQRNAAIDDFTFVIENAPVSENDLIEAALIQRGYRMIDRQWYQAAVNDFGQAATLNPDNLQAWLEVGYNQMRLSRYDEAIDAFAEVLERDPDNYDAIAETARAYRHSGRHTQTKAFLSNIFAEDLPFTDSQLANLYWIRAESRLFQNTPGLAVNDLRQAVELDELTSNGAALMNLGWTLGDLGDTDDGIMYLRRYIELAEENGWEINQGAVNKLAELERQS